MNEHRFQHECNADLPTRITLRKEGAEQEMERIIKLLNERILLVQGTTCGGSKGQLVDLIALIKGETK